MTKLSLTAHPTLTLPHPSGQTPELEPGISVVVPVYNSQDTLRELIAELAKVLPRCAERFEVILVNDASRDASWALVSELAAQHSWVEGVDLMRNYGQHNALLCGVRTARYATLVTLDDDLQHPPAEIPKLLAELAKGFDVVYGTPDKEAQALWRAAASKITKLALQSAVGVQNARNVSAFRAFHTSARRAFLDHSGPHICLDVLLSWATTRFGSVTVRHDPRRHGESNYTFRKLVAHALNMMTGFSTLPLRLSTLVGFSVATFGLLVLVWVVSQTLISGRAVPGFAFLASIVAIFSGAQLFTLGIFGEYLARIHFRMMDRPTYVVREATPAAEKREAA